MSAKSQYDHIDQYQYDHINETRVPALDIATYICLPMAFIAVIFRVLSRRISKVPLKADDWWLFVGLVSGWHHHTYIDGS